MFVIQCPVLIILQSYEQLVRGYGVENAKIIFENCNSKLYYGGLSHESARIVSDSLGMRTESYSSKGIFEQNQPLHRTARPMMTPDEVRRIKNDQGIFISGNHKPILLKQIKPFYTNRTLKKRSRK